MKRTLFTLLALLAFASGAAFAQPRLYSQAELDALLAPVALYPDDVLGQVLDAAQYPGQVQEAARGVESPYFPRSVQALRSTPELLQRMAESPQWLLDLGAAYREQAPQVMQTVQELRLRAGALGYAPSQFAYVPYYDPLVVYGPWWQPAVRPVLWRPWPRRQVFVSNVYVQPRIYASPPAFAATAAPAPRPAPREHSRRRDEPRPAAAEARPHVHRAPPPTITPYVRVPESRRQPIVQTPSNPPSPAAQMQAANSAAYAARARAANQPSPAARLQAQRQEPPRTQPAPRPHEHRAGRPL